MPVPFNRRSGSVKEIGIENKILDPDFYLRFRRRNPAESVKARIRVSVPGSGIAAGMIVVPPVDPVPGDGVIGKTGVVGVIGMTGSEEPGAGTRGE